MSHVVLSAYPRMQNISTRYGVTKILEKKLRQLNKRSQWTSTLTQNEILELVGDLVLEEISDEARERLKRFLQS